MFKNFRNNVVLDSLAFISGTLLAAGKRGAARMDDIVALLGITNAHMSLNNDRLDAIDARLEEASAHRMELDDAMEMVHDAVMQMNRSSGPAPVTTATTFPGPTDGHWSWTELGVQGPDGDDGKDA